MTAWFALSWLMACTTDLWTVVAVCPTLRVLPVVIAATLVIVVLVAVVSSSLLLNTLYMSCSVVYTPFGPKCCVAASPICDVCMPHQWMFWGWGMFWDELLPNPWIPSAGRWLIVSIWQDSNSADCGFAATGDYSCSHSADWSQVWLGCQVHQPRQEYWGTPSRWMEE